MLTSFYQPDKRNFTYLFLNISSLISALRELPLDQREEAFAPLIPFIDVTIQTSSGSVQPLNLIYRCLETLVLSLRGKLHTQKAPNPTISTSAPYYCPLHFPTSICAQCCDLDLSLYSHTGRVVPLTLLIEDFIKTVFFYFINYRFHGSCTWYLLHRLSCVLISDTEI
jgi:hypothetical protein